MDPLVQVLLTLVVGLGGAYMGAKWGAEQGLQKFKSERAFDARAEWYARMIRTLMAANTSLLQASRRRTETISQDELDAVSAVHDAGMEGYLYASSDGIRMLMHLQLYIEEVRAAGGPRRVPQD